MDAVRVVTLLGIAGAGGGLAWVGGQPGTRVSGIPVFGFCVALAFIVQGVAFIPAWVARTERFFDLVGSATYLAVTAFALGLSGARDPRSLLVAALVWIWAVRLGVFLYLRIQDTGRDRRFDAIKRSAGSFFVAWMLQGLWVSVTVAPALAVITAATKPGLGPLAIAGTALWAVGFTFEVIADEQKRRFRKDPANRGRFISTGLWRWSRHPNYFGEIALWCGVALVALPALEGWALLTLVSPLFVAVLLTRISGIPLLERSADERWGGDPEYEEWKLRTPVLVPRPPWNS